MKTTTMRMKRIWTLLSHSHEIQTMNSILPTMMKKVIQKKKKNQEVYVSNNYLTIVSVFLDGTQVAAVSDIAVVDPDEHISDGEDSEAEDDLIKATDNLVLVGHVDDDASSLEVYVYNEEENSFYVHHDFLLPSFPLCIEWMNYDPESKDPGNMCAIGCIDPIITIWDLDIQDTLEPAVKLGSKGKRKKGIEKFGHTDAVLDLSWNTNFP